jgi:hypothetical protein
MKILWKALLILLLVSPLIHAEENQELPLAYDDLYAVHYKDSWHFDLKSDALYMLHDELYKHYNQLPKEMYERYVNGKKMTPFKFYTSYFSVVQLEQIHYDSMHLAQIAIAIFNINAELSEVVSADKTEEFNKHMQGMARFMYQKMYNVYLVDKALYSLAPEHDLSKVYAKYEDNFENYYKYYSEFEITMRDSLDMFDVINNDIFNITNDFDKVKSVNSELYYDTHTAAHLLDHYMLQIRRYYVAKEKEGTLEGEELQKAYQHIGFINQHQLQIHSRLYYLHSLK